MVAIAAYLILAVVNLLDKFLVGTVLKNSRIYAFSACVMGLLVVSAAPWFLVWPGWPLLWLNILNGGIFAVALWSLYEALRRGEASRILVFIGGLTPIFSLIFSILFFQATFSIGQWLGLFFILLGVLLIAFLPTSRSYLARVFKKLRWDNDNEWGGLMVAALSALAYAVYFMGTKYAYIYQPFASAFIWTRLGAALFVLLFLLKKSDRQAIFNSFGRRGSSRSNLLVVFNQGLGSLGFILQNYAIFLGSVVLVNALQGVQYAFLLIISTVLALMSPKLLKESFSGPVLLQKIAAVIIIAIGLYFLTF